MGFSDVINFFSFSKEKKLKNGVHYLKYENGKKMVLGKVSSGKKSGVWETGYENGVLKSRGSYNDGEKNGYWEYRYDNGKLKQQEYYKLSKSYLS